ncbi:hypothetical protein, partial [Burkholderia glumae]|uniref:hypothetical protein n=1 Tax=Burkholderia glumae TaxID=337 RepID=UPI0019D6DEB6
RANLERIFIGRFLIGGHSLRESRDGGDGPAAPRVGQCALRARRCGFGPADSAREAAAGGRLVLGK